jgi:hypothetical protein
MNRSYLNGETTEAVTSPSAAGWRIVHSAPPEGEGGAKLYPSLPAASAASSAETLILTCGSREKGSWGS